MLACMGEQVLQEAEKARRMAERKDYYAILGLSHDASVRDIKQAYRKAAQQYHPDKAAAAGIGKEEAEQKFSEIAESYEVAPCLLTVMAIAWLQLHDSPVLRPKLLAMSCMSDLLRTAHVRASRCAQHWNS